MSAPEVALDVAAALEDERLSDALSVLSVPVHLTDTLATTLLAQWGPGPEVMSLLFMTDLVREDQHEWSVRPDARGHGLRLIKAQPTRFSAINESLLILSQEVASDEAHHPAYLRALVGHAYHGVQQGESGADHLYAKVSAYGDRRWKRLADFLLREQIADGVAADLYLPATFAGGMVAYHEGRKREAIAILRPLMERRERRIECAVSAHLVGNSDFSQGRRAAGIEALRWGAEASRELGDDWGLAVTLNSLGRALGRGQQTRAEAIGLLRESWELGIKMGRDDHVGRVLHSFAITYRKSQEFGKARKSVLGSIEIAARLQPEYVPHLLNTLAAIEIDDPHSSGQPEQIIERAMADLAQTEPRQRSVLLLTRARAQMRQGELDDAAKSLELARSLAKGLSDRRQWARVELECARLLLLNQPPDTASAFGHLLQSVTLSSSARDEFALGLCLEIGRTLEELGFGPREFRLAIESAPVEAEEIDHALLACSHLSENLAGAAFNELAARALDAEDIQLAAEHLEKALSNEGWHLGRSYCLRGLVDWMSESTASAVRWWKLSVDRAGSDPESAVTSARRLAIAATDDPDEAYKWWLYVAERSAGAARDEALCNLGKIAVRRKEFVEAEGYLITAAGSADQRISGEAKVTLGVLFASQGDLDRARAIWERLVDESGDVGETARQNLTWLVGQRKRRPPR